MGKREVRVIVVRKPATLALLALVSVLMAVLVYWLSGKAYSTEDEPIVRILLGAMHRQQAPSRSVVLSELMPVVANILLFVPWGFLAFLLFDSPAHSRTAAYIATVLAGAVFATTLAVWQDFLPTRVTGAADALINVAGAFCGALAGDLRKRVRIRFDY